MLKQWLLNRKEQAVNKLSIQLKGKYAEKAAIVFIMNKFQETTAYHMDQYIKVESDIAKIEKEIEILMAGTK